MNFLTSLWLEKKNMSAEDVYKEGPLVQTCSAVDSPAAPAVVWWWRSSVMALDVFHSGVTSIRWRKWFTETGSGAV